jgi:hypothetical protein
MKRISTLAAVIVFAVVLLTPAVADAAPNGPGASGWKLGNYNPSGMAVSMAQVAPVAGGLATFNFTNQPNTALLLNTQGNSPFLGNDVGKTISATFTISGAVGAFTAYPDQCYPNGLPPNVRLFFETSYSAGGFAYSDYWWADDAWVMLANGTFTISAKVNPTTANWSDWGGETSAANAARFTSAASNVTGIGLSFGGYCHYESGVGTTDGTGALALNSFSVS